MTDGTSIKPRRPREQLLVLKLCREFLSAPKSAYRLEELCAALVDYEVGARLRDIQKDDSAKVDSRAEVRNLDICRDCRVQLDATNRSGVSGYQCQACKKQYHRQYMAAQRAKKKALPIA
jgi:hypothetical protein